MSIVTPSYNSGSFIEETIRSVLLQRYPNLDYFVIDGGSTDETLEIIRKYEPWLTNWVSEPDKGQSSALNKGFSHATGDIYAYLNSDDVYCRGAFQRVAKVFAGQEDTTIIVNFSGAMFGNESPAVFVPGQMTKPKLHVWLCSEASLFQPSTFWTKKLHERVGGFNEDLHFCMDKEFFLKAVFEFGEYNGENGQPIAMFRKHSSAKTTVMEEAKWRENEILWRRYRAKAPYVEILAKEYRYLSGEFFLQNVFINETLGQKLVNLFRAVQCCPHYLGTRFYWGAIKKTLFSFWR